MTDTDALDALIEAVERGDDAAVKDEARDLYKHQNQGWAFEVGRVYSGSLDVAKALHEALFPGWLWRVCHCYLTDDAFVSPDFNDPAHSERLHREFPMLIDGQEWADATDIALQGGNPARALLLSDLYALRLIRAYRAQQGEK